VDEVSELEKKFGREFLQGIIDWVGAHCNITDVFTTRAIQEAASEYKPEDVFDDKTLLEWADGRGLTEG